MIRGLYTAVTGLISQEAKMDVITNNMANADTDGYKSDNLAIKKFNDVLIESREQRGNSAPITNVIGSLSFGSRIDETDTCFDQGTLQGTDSKSDFAIEGRGFFKVERDNGTTTQIYYTRNGHFHVNGKGMLVTDDGDNVLDSNGNKINVGKNDFNCDADGNLTIGNNPNKVKLGLVDFNTNLSSKDAYKNLIKDGNNLYKTTDTPQTFSGSVKQSSLEKSNVNTINEMVNMMTVMRTFETNQKVVQAMDETLGKTVTDVGTVR